SEAYSHSTLHGKFWGKSGVVQKTWDTIFGGVRSNPDFIKAGEKINLSNLNLPENVQVALTGQPTVPTPPVTPPTSPPAIPPVPDLPVKPTLPVEQGLLDQIMQWAVEHRVLVLIAVVGIIILGILTWKLISWIKSRKGAPPSPPTPKPQKTRAAPDKAPLSQYPYSYSYPYSYPYGTSTQNGGNSFVEAIIDELNHRNGNKAKGDIRKEGDEEVIEPTEVVEEPSGPEEEIIDLIDVVKEGEGKANDKDSNGNDWDEDKERYVKRLIKAFVIENAVAEFDGEE
ncbi:unnamed protein product, partial [marine sediment metagenome]